MRERESLGVGQLFRSCEWQAGPLSRGMGPISVFEAARVVVHWLQVTLPLRFVFRSAAFLGVGSNVTRVVLLLACVNYVM